MTLKNLFKTAIVGLKTHKMRSFLTILGIVIGITSIILIMSIGKGAENLILGQIQGIGSKTIFVAPGREPKGPTDTAQIFSDSLKDRDLELLKSKSNVPHLAKIMPIVLGGETASFMGETYRVSVFGATELIQEIFDAYPDQGVFFSDEDVKAKSAMAIIGLKVKDELFGSSEALNQWIKIKGKNFRIVGILPKKGEASLFNFDEMVIIPFTTAQQYIFGIKYFHRLVIEAESEEVIPQTVEDIKITLRQSHNITDPEKDDFFIETQADLMQRISVVTSVLTLFLVSVAAISLIVGGIGIMNIMLVSVTERTREIGLRKAIGATEKNIMLQFLLEAVILTAAGGAVGIFLGAVFSFLSSIILSQTLGASWNFILPLSAIAWGLGVSAFVGLAFGFYPARQAAKKSPIEALRYE